MRLKKTFSIRNIIIITSILFVILKHLIFSLEGILAFYCFLAAIIIFFFVLLAITYCLFGLIKHRRFTLRTPLLFCVLSLFIVFFHPIERVIEKFKSPPVLFAFCEHSMYCVSLKLREDKTFQYQTGGFLTRDIYHGIYSINKDTISLNFSDDIPRNFSNRVMISKKKLLPLDSVEDYEHRLDITHNVIK